jgi:hypothetical protein
LPEPPRFSFRSHLTFLFEFREHFREHLPPIAAVDHTKHIGQAPDGLVRLVGILVALLRKLIARELPSGQFLDALEQGIPPSSGDWPFSLSLLEIAARIRHDGTVRHPD